MSNQPDSALVEALTQIVHASGPEGDHTHAARELGTKLAKQKELKAALEPIAKPIKHGNGMWIVQACLEQPAEHPLHIAARQLIANGSVSWTVYLAIASGGPKRVVRRLAMSNHGPTVFAFEDEPRVSLWSLETGQHLRDVKIPAKKGDTVLLFFCDIADGTLRAITPRGLVLQSKPGASEFVKLLDLGNVAGGFAANGDVTRIVARATDELLQKDDGEWVVLTLHHVGEKKTVDIEVPLSRTGSDWHVVDGRYAVIPGMRFTPIGDDDGREDFKVAVFDFETGTVKVYPVGGDVYATPGPKAGTASLTWNEESGSGNWLKKAVVLDVATGAMTPFEHKEGVAEGYFFSRGQIKKDGQLVGSYVVDLESNRTSGVFDPKTGRFAIASEVPAAAVHVVTRFDPTGSTASSASRTEKATASSLAWARAGAVLRYSIADFDAEDEWDFVIVDATNGLHLQARADDSDEIDVTFGANALASATAFASFSQGGTSEDTSKPIDKKLPPFVLSHASFDKLASGKKLPWKTEWTDGDKLEPEGRATAQIEVGGAQLTVAVLNAAGETARITVLDDASWPLLLERSEGDCHVKLVSIDLSKANGDLAAKPATAASSAKPGKVAKTERAPASPPSGGSVASGAWQRYESTEDGASKFWEVSVSGSTLNIRFGKIGTNGQAQTKSFASDDAANAERDKLVREKTKKGYRAAGE